MRGDTVIVEPSVPVWVGHKYYLVSPDFLKVEEMHSPLLWAYLIPTPLRPLLPVALILATRPTLSGAR